MPNTISAEFLSPEQLEAEMGWSTRTRYRMEYEGLRYIKVRNSKFYPVEEVRKFLLKHVQTRCAPPRGRGRPPKEANTA